MGFRPNYFTCIAHLYLYYILLVPHTYASYIRHWCIFSHYEIQYKSFNISNMVSESLLWPFLSSLVFISVTPFFFNIASAITTIVSAFHRWTSDVIQPHPWVPDQQPPSLRSFTLHRPLSLASPLQTLPRLRFWSYHRDPFTSIYKTMKASTPSETACTPTRRSKFLYGWSRAPCAVTCLHAPPRTSELRHAPPRAVTRRHAHARASFLLLTSSSATASVDVIIDQTVDLRWLWPLTFPQCWLFQARFFLPSFSRRFHFCSLFLHIVSLNG